MESVASGLIAPHLKEGQGQVGVGITVRHMGPTPIGHTVRAEAELIAVDRRKMSFKVKVFEGDDTADLSKTMAALDGRLKGAERWAQRLDKYGKKERPTEPAPA